MLSLPGSVRIFLARDPVDFRKAFDGLCAIIQNEFRDDPFTGHLFIFFNKRRDRIKILHWDRNGFWLFYKRLERGTFDQYPGFQGGFKAKRIEIDRATLQLILEGIDIHRSHYRRHFARRVDLRKRSATG